MTFPRVAQIPVRLKYEGINVRSNKSNPKRLGWILRKQFTTKNFLRIGGSIGVGVYTREKTPTFDLVLFLLLAPTLHWSLIMSVIYLGPPPTPIRCCRVHINGITAGWRLLFLVDAPVGPGIVLVAPVTVRVASSAAGLDISGMGAARLKAGWEYLGWREGSLLTVLCSSSKVSVELPSTPWQVCI